VNDLSREAREALCWKKEGGGRVRIDDHGLNGMNDRGVSGLSRGSPYSCHVVLLLSQVHCPLSSSAASTPVFLGAAVLRCWPFAATAPYAHERHFMCEYAPLKCSHASREGHVTRTRAPMVGPLHRRSTVLESLFPGPYFFNVQPATVNLRSVNSKLFI